MTPGQKSTLKAFVPETLLYGVLAAGYCYGVVRLLGHPLQSLFREHRIEYAALALGLMIVQGFVLERMTHALWSVLGRLRKARA